MNYTVVCLGHISGFDQYEAARAFAADFGGEVLNNWGLSQLANSRATADDSHVFHIDLLDEPYRSAFNPAKPWVCETDRTQDCFATEDEACRAQRDHRTQFGFDAMTGLPLTP